MLKREVMEVLINGTRDQRVYLCEKDPAYFVAYYFTHYLTHKFAPFHFDFIQDFQGLTDGSIDEAAWVTFRESAKTSLAKILVTWAIVYKKKRFINWDSYDRGNAEAALVDIANELSSNRRLIHDFGHIYNPNYKIPDPQDMDEIKRPRRIGVFVTNNKVRVEAFSTGQSTRGRLYRNVRPDFYVLDDIETIITKESPTVTAKTIEHIKELQGGLGAGGSVLYLGNYISDTGVMEYLLNGDEDTKGLNSKKRCIARNIAIEDQATKVISWPDKYTKTDKEAAEINKHISIPWRRVVSLESKERMLGTRAYRREMLNEPELAEGYFFDRRKVKQALDTIAREPDKVVSGTRYYAKPNESHAYAGGCDTAEGIGSDASAGAIIDHSQYPRELVACYGDSAIDPGVNGVKMVKLGRDFGEAFLVVEINGPGYGTVQSVLQQGYTNMYTRLRKEKTTNEDMKVYGWYATQQTKYEVLDNFRRAWEDGELVIYDKALLKEMYYFKNVDMRIMKADANITRHFDLLRSAALAWEGGDQAVSKNETEQMHKAPRREPYRGV